MSWHCVNLPDGSGQFFFIIENLKFIIVCMAKDLTYYCRFIPKANTELQWMMKSINTFSWHEVSIN